MRLSVVVLLPLQAWRTSAAKKYWEHDSGHGHRQELRKCGNKKDSKDFECPAGHRPVQQPENAYKVWTWEACAPKELMDSGYKHAGRNIPTPSKCCELKYLCANTCGMKLQQCFNIYWECVETECDRLARANKEEEREILDACVWGGARHDLSQLPEDEGAFQGSEVPRGASENHCTLFERMQQQACKCVPTSEWEVKLQERLEDFFRTYEPSMLNRKGKLKDKKLWKAYKGKKPELFFNLHKSYLQKGAVEVRNFTDKRSGHTLDDEL
jgi:hypothetical protein